MTNEQFWKELDKLAVNECDEISVIKFAALLMEGYLKSLDLFEIALVDSYDESTINQLYSGTFDKRLMLCCTTMKKGKHDVYEMEKNGTLSSGTKVCVAAVPCKQILDNLYYKNEIAALVFNIHSGNPFIVPAELLREMIGKTGMQRLPENYTPADPVRFKSNGSKKKEIPIKEWAAKKCPPAYLVLLLDGEWDMPSGDEERVAKVFCSQWKNVKKYIEKQNKKSGKVSLSDFSIEYTDPDISSDLSIDFFNLLNTIDMFLLNTSRYAELVDFCRDMLELFDNDDEYISIWTGLMGEGLWEQDPGIGENFFKEHLVERNDRIMGYYSLHLLDEKRWEDAEQALKGYEDSDDETIQDRFEWLKGRK